MKKYKVLIAILIIFLLVVSGANAQSSGESSAARSGKTIEKKQRLIYKIRVGEKRSVKILDRRTDRKSKNLQNKLEKETNEDVQGKLMMNYINLLDEHNSKIKEIKSAASEKIFFLTL